MKIATRCVRVSTDRDPYGAVSPPIYQTATFRQPSATEFGEYDYTRTANPTRALVEEQIAALEGGRHACAFASGMAALSAVTRLVQAGEEILAGDDLYGGTCRLLSRVAPRHGIRVRYVDATDPRAVEEAISPATRLLLIETPTNPLLRVADIAALASVAHSVRRDGILLAVDNSLLSPCLQQPLGLGADLVIHSATKALSGHSDVSGGAVVTKDSALHQEIAFSLNAEGAGLAPFDSWLLLRGIKTLALRVERQSASARKVAEFLAAHPAVRTVHYPGLGPVISFTTGVRSCRAVSSRRRDCSPSRSASARSAPRSACRATCRTPAFLPSCADAWRRRLIWYACRSASRTWTTSSPIWPRQSQRLLEAHP